MSFIGLTHGTELKKKKKETLCRPIFEKSEDVSPLISKTSASENFLFLIGFDCIARTCFK